MIVDDDADFACLLGAALKGRGAEVESVTSAFGAVARAAGMGKARRPNIIVLDCDLPALAGISVLGMLPKNPKAAEVPVLLVSAALPPEAASILSAHPRARFVSKDGHFNALADQVLALNTESST